MPNPIEFENIQLECPKCSGTEFIGPTHPKDIDYLTFAACGKSRTFADLKAANTDKAKNQADQPDTWP